MGPVLHVSGADLMDGTPIYDIKPYLAYADSHPQAAGGFTDRIADHKLKVEFPETCWARFRRRKGQQLLRCSCRRSKTRLSEKCRKRIWNVLLEYRDVHFKVQGEMVSGLCSGESSKKARIKGDSKENPKKSLQKVGIFFIKWRKSFSRSTRIMKKVVKFGGSSLANAEQFEKVGDIIRSEESRRFRCSIRTWQEIRRRYQGNRPSVRLL